MADNIFLTPSRLTATATVSTDPVWVGAFIVATDGVNDPVVAAYNDTDALTAGNRVIPSCTYDASVLGLNGFTLGFMTDFDTALHVTISNLGTGEVMIFYRTKSDLSKYAII